MKKLKVVLCLALVLCMVVSIAPVSALADSQPVAFSDIENWADTHNGKPHWATKWINYWANQAAADGSGYVVGGYADGTFRPDNFISRGAVAAILNRVHGFERTGAVKDFSDVPATSAFYNAIMACADNGVVSGYGDAANTFRPANNISRQAAIAMIARCAMTDADYAEFANKAADKNYLASLWSDYSGISENYYAEFCYMAKYCGLSGFSDGTVRPTKDITRAEFVSLLFRVEVNADSKVYKFTVSIADSSKTEITCTASYLTSDSVVLETLVPMIVALRDNLKVMFPSPDMAAIMDEGVALAKNGFAGKWNDSTLSAWQSYVDTYSNSVGGDASAKEIFADVETTVGDMTAGTDYVMTLQDTYAGRTDITYTVTITAEVME